MNEVIEKWEVLEDGDELKVIESGSLEYGAGWRSYCEVCNEISSPENAHLIAAAPELLAALQGFIEAQLLPEYHQSIARSVISKALGKD